MQQPAVINAEHADDDTLHALMKGDVPIRFDWDNRWLKGDEYAYIVRHMDAYCETMHLQKFNQKTHPESIYMEPESKYRIRV